MRIGTVLICLALLAGCGGSAAPDLPAGPARPPVWVFHDEDTRIVLVGSIHQLPTDMAWTGGRLGREIDAADELILELSPAEVERASSVYATVSRDEPQMTLQRRFGRERTRQIRSLIGSGKNPLESWAVALAIGNRLAVDSGLAADAGVEAVLTARFLANDRPVGGLETAAQQLALFDDLTPAVQDRMVVATLASAGESRARTRRLLAAWATGDLTALAAAADEALADTPMLVEPIVHARNRAWAVALEQRLDRSGDVLVAVGVGHLVGEGSLLDELRRRGYRPMRLQ